MLKKFYPILAFAVLSSVALLQGPGVDSTARVNAMSLVGGGCEYDGTYVQSDCRLFNSNCTSGFTEMALVQGSSHKEDGTIYRNGSCVGNANCPTAINTTGLTTTGCSPGPDPDPVFVD
jgi:hypothetical protein